jgi:hypothetical protein
MWPCGQHRSRTVARPTSGEIDPNAFRPRDSLASEILWHLIDFGYGPAPTDAILAALRGEGMHVKWRKPLVDRLSRMGPKRGMFGFAPRVLFLAIPRLAEPTSAWFSRKVPHFLVGSMRVPHALVASAYRSYHC